MFSCYILTLIFFSLPYEMMMMMMMMMMMNSFCGMVDRRKALSLISSRYHCQRSSPSRIFDTPRAGFEPAQNLSSGFVEWSCPVVITTTPRRHDIPRDIYSFHMSIFPLNQLIAFFYRHYNSIQSLWFPHSFSLLNHCCDFNSNLFFINPFFIFFKSININSFLLYVINYIYNLWSF